MGEGARALVAFTASVFSLATLSVILSQRAATAGVINSAGNALSSIIGAATAPVTGGGSVGSVGNLGNFLGVPLG